ncbi:hypothetical protein C8F01DRAFT_1102257 [Mycena amicta]|nr:hypothetical protein C8F01DRAFT_1102257 [Mycena amicta]
MSVRPHSVLARRGLAPSSSRVSVAVLARVVPSLYRTNALGDELPSSSKSPLVTLKFSSQSFLDSVVKDDASSNPLYVIRTAGTNTNVLRSDPWDGLTKTAEIKWPKRIPTKGKTREILGVLVQLADGRWQPSDAVLKPGTLLSSPPKFNIPNYPHSMRWKRVGSAYWCTTSSVKGPVATFHPAVEGVPPRIKVYETLHDKYESRPVISHNGVSIVLLDHLIVTAMLLVTDVQDWMLVQKYEGAEDGAPSIAPTSSSSDQMDQQPQSAPASASQWRKILYGEPIFPKRNPTSMRSVSTTDLSKPLPTTSKQMAKILYGDPIYPSLTASPVTSVWDSEDEVDDDGRGSLNTNSALPSPQSTHFPTTAPTRIHSPSSESMYYQDGQPASHPYMDPGYYGEESAIPPVPQIPAQYASSSRGTTPPDSARSVSRPKSRDLPPTPISPSTPLSPLRGNRSQSTPPREGPVVSYERRPSEPLFLTLQPKSQPSSTTSSSLPPTPIRTLSRSQSMKLRQLPQPPTTPTESSSSNMRAGRRGSTYSTRSQSSVGSARALPVPPGQAPPLPPLPIPRKDGMWLYPWGPEGRGGPRTAPDGEAPPPYAERTNN